MQHPKWATPERQAHLVKLWGLHGNRCLLGHLSCPEAEHYLTGDSYAQTVLGSELVGLPYHPEWVGGAYFIKEETCIHYWIEDDRDERLALEHLEKQRLTVKIRQGQFDTIAREEYHASHPLYYLEGIGVDALIHKRVAKVRIACSFVRLWVEVPSKNAMRQARRYGGKGPKSLEEAIVQAVKDYQRTH